MRASHIASFEVPSCKCNFCEEDSSQVVSVFGRYIHLFWIPLFPVGKKVIGECTNCDRTFEKRDFPEQLKSQYSEIKHNAKRPFWHWLGLA